jgi:regulator of replication initiation timing
MNNSQYNIENTSSRRNLIENSTAMTDVQIKTAIQQHNASIAHKSSRLRVLRAEISEIEREITHILAENELLRLTLKERG